MCQQHIQIIMVKMVTHSTEHKTYEMVSVVAAAALITTTTTTTQNCYHCKKKNGLKKQENKFCSQYFQDNQITDAHMGQMRTAKGIVGKIK